jgi:hypothetical protein
MDYPIAAVALISLISQCEKRRAILSRLSSRIERLEKKLGCTRQTVVSIIGASEEKFAAIQEGYLKKTGLDPNTVLFVYIVGLYGTNSDGKEVPVNRENPQVLVFRDGSREDLSEYFASS